MADSGIDVQLKVRQNAAELGEFMKDLDRWEKDIRTKDEELMSSKTALKKNLPPVRNQSRKKKKSKAKKVTPPSKDGTNIDPKRISSYDYNSWDRFNVEEELKAIDDNEEMETLTSSSSEEEDESYQEMIEIERRLQKAVLEKDRGNDLFKEGKYEEAINRYTLANQLDPSNAIMPANRAMALLKVDRYICIESFTYEWETYGTELRYGAAEKDCTTALSLDSTYTKAYLRRGTARFHLNKLKESLADYEEALRIEPGNKQAHQEIIKLQKILNVNQVDEKDKKDLEKTKPKVPLKRIHIDEIGSDSSEDESETTSHSPTDTTNNNDTATESKVEQNAEKSYNQDSKITEITSSEQNTSTEENLSPKKAQKQSEECKKLNGSSRASNSKPKVFEVPKSSMQLQADWKILRNKPQELFEYLKNINPKSYSKLFQQSIDSDMLTTIILVYHDFYIPASLPVFSELQSLARVQRFGMAVMFLSEDHKK
ncbi:hypothetical protein QZH41_016263, partial [Actinostola sp. cb2023]